MEAKGTGSPPQHPGEGGVGAGRPAPSHSHPRLIAEGLSEGGLPGPLGEAFPEEEDATRPRLRRRAQPLLLEGRLEEKTGGPGPLAGAPSATGKGLGHQGEDRGWGLTAGDVASAGQGVGRA